MVCGGARTSTKGSSSRSHLKQRLPHEGRSLAALRNELVEGIGFDEGTRSGRSLAVSASASTRSEESIISVGVYASSLDKPFGSRDEGEREGQRWLQ